MKRIYNKPNAKIIDVECSSILASSASETKEKKVAQPTAPTKSATSEVKKQIPSVKAAKVTYNIVGEQIHINIPLPAGAKNCVEKVVVDPEGDKCIIYDCYFFTMKQFAQNATDIPYYIEKIQQALNYKMQNLSSRDIVLKVAENHIVNHGRIIDGDLSMIISAVAKVTGDKLDTDFEWSGLDVVLKSHESKVFFTKFTFTPFGPSNPTLITATEFKNM